MHAPIAVIIKEVVEFCVALVAKVTTWPSWVSRRVGAAFGIQVRKPLGVVTLDIMRSAEIDPLVAVDIVSTLHHICFRHHFVLMSLIDFHSAKCRLEALPNDCALSHNPSCSNKPVLYGFTFAWIFLCGPCSKGKFLMFTGIVLFA